MIPFAFMLFMLCPSNWTVETQCEQGIVYAKSCAEARAWIRRGLRPGRVFVEHYCTQANGDPG